MYCGVFDLNIPNKNKNIFVLKQRTSSVFLSLILSLINLLYSQKDARGKKQKGKKKEKRKRITKEKKRRERVFEMRNKNDKSLTLKRRKKNYEKRKRKKNKIKVFKRMFEGKREIEKV